MVATAHRDETPARATNRSEAEAFPATVPIEPPAGIIRRFDGHHPAWVAALVTAVGYLVLATVITGMGLALTGGPLARPIREFDRWVSAWFADQRMPGLNDFTSYLGLLADTTTVIVIVTLVVIVLAVRRSWPRAGLLAIALTVEVTVFLTAAAIVARDRPDVRQLDDVPPTSSFPSGHTAAAIALYVGLALVLTPSVRNRALRTALWIVALLIPIVVAGSRLYRGMHAVTDVVAGVLLGTMALVIAILAVRAAEAVAERRRRAEDGRAPPPTTASKLEPVR